MRGSCPPRSLGGTPGGLRAAPPAPFSRQEEKKTLREEEEEAAALRARAGLSIPLLREEEEDRRLAALLTLRAPDCAWGAPGEGPGCFPGGVRGGPAPP